MRIRMPGIPTVFAHTDVCRPDLLVEIEGVAFSALKKPTGKPKPNGSDDHS